MDQDRCIQCEREYTKHSRPLWVFDADLRLRGTAHTGCASRWLKSQQLSYQYSFSGNPDKARRSIWIRQQMVSFNVRVLFIDYDQRDSLVTRWRVAYLSDHVIDEILRIAAEMDRQYREQFAAYPLLPQVELRRR